MSTFIAALPMYDWPEIRAEIDAEWAAIRDRLRMAGIDAPEALTRRNADMPAVPGGIRDRGGEVIAPDPAILPPDELDLRTLWLHPALLYSQSCWGMIETGDLRAHVRVLAQPDYSAFEGGEGELYFSVVVMRADAAPQARTGLPLDLLRGCRLAYNASESLSGYLALQRDLEVLGEGLSIFAELIETGSHRASALAIAGGGADVAAIDCRTWSLFRRFEPVADALIQVGRTSPRKGLPHIRSTSLPREVASIVDDLFMRQPAQPPGQSILDASLNMTLWRRF